MPTPATKPQLPQASTPLPMEPAPIDADAVRAALEARWHRLRNEFGDFGVGPESFAAHVHETLRRRMERSGTREALPLLERMALDDLYLAQGCAAHNDAAWHAFERTHGAVLDRLSLLFSTSAIGAGEARQELLCALFSGRSGKGSAFHSYRGEASLRAWLRVVLRRIVIDLYRSVRWRPLPGSRSPDAAAESLVARDQTPLAEPHLIETQTAQALALITGEVILALPMADREALLAYHRDGARLEDVGRTLGVHLSTAKRQLDRVRADVARTVLKLARDRLALPPHEVLAARDLMADFFGFTDVNPTEPGT